MLYYDAYDCIKRFVLQLMGVVVLLDNGENLMYE